MSGVFYDATQVAEFGNRSEFAPIEIGSEPPSVNIRSTSFAFRGNRPEYRHHPEPRARFSVTQRRDASDQGLGRGQGELLRSLQDDTRLRQQRLVR